jgi:hypothetical protein
VTRSRILAEKTKKARISAGLSLERQEINGNLNKEISLTYISNPGYRTKTEMKEKIKQTKIDMEKKFEDNY